MSQPARVLVYVIQGCPFCKMAKDLLDGLGIEYEVRDLSDHPDRRAFTASILPGHTSVPLVIIDGKPIGGARELEAMHRDGSLERALGEDSAR